MTQGPRFYQAAAAQMAPPAMMPSPRWAQPQPQMRPMTQVNSGFPVMMQQTHYRTPGRGGSGGVGGPIGKNFRTFMCLRCN